MPTRNNDENLSSIRNLAPAVVSTETAQGLPIERRKEDMDLLGVLAKRIEAEGVGLSYQRRMPDDTVRTVATEKIIALNGAHDWARYTASVYTDLDPSNDTPQNMVKISCFNRAVADRSSATKDEIWLIEYSNFSGTARRSDMKIPNPSEFAVDDWLKRGGMLTTGGEDTKYGQDLIEQMVTDFRTGSVDLLRINNARQTATEEAVGTKLEVTDNPPSA